MFNKKINQNLVGKKGNWVMLQGWKNMLFLHWPISPEVIKPHLPFGIELDTYDGNAWISIVSFKVNKARIRYLPSIPYFPSMLQVNVRTYVKRNKERGIYFFTVDTNKLSAVLGANIATLPYYRANMLMKNKGNSYQLHSMRKGDKKAKWKVTYEAKGAPFVPKAKSIDSWLLERYIVWTYKYQNLYRGDISHEKWEVQKANVHIEGNTLLSFLFSKEIDSAPIAHYAMSKVSVNWIPIKVE